MKAANRKLFQKFVSYLIKSEKKIFVTTLLWKGKCKFGGIRKSLEILGRYFRSFPCSLWHLLALTWVNCSLLKMYNVDSVCCFLITAWENLFCCKQHDDFTSNHFRRVRVHLSFDTCTTAKSFFPCWVSVISRSNMVACRVVHVLALRQLLPPGRNVVFFFPF